MEDINWEKLELVIFDVDGTLYDQPKLRWRMFFKILRYYALKPWRLHEILVLYHFRKERERRAGGHYHCLEEAQYVWCADKVNLSIESIKKIIDYWMFKAPNEYLQQCRYQGLLQFVALLKKSGIRTAVYSDYPAQMKLDALELSVDMVVSSTDDFINALKPLPVGINFIVEKMGIDENANCLYIGDRDELDGQCARNAFMPFLLVDKEIDGQGFYEQMYSQLNQSKIKKC